MTPLVLALAAVVGQCPTLPPDQECCHYSGTVYTKKYVAAVLEDGRRITVPVINGYMPALDLVKMTDGSMQRNYYYEDGYKYRGEASISYGGRGKSEYDPRLAARAGIRESSSFDPPDDPAPVKRNSDGLPTKKVEMPKPDDVKALQDNVEALQESVRELQELVRKQQAELKAKSVPVPVVSPEPKKVVAPSPMKKPSEFDKDEPK